MLLKTLTLNIWGLLLVSYNREERIRSISRSLESSSADVVTLQECWVHADARQLTAAGLLAGLAHSRVLHNGLFGPGLVILSRHPIVDAGFEPYSVSGDPTRLLHGDWLAAKGMGWATLQLPPDAAAPPDAPPDRVTVINTHTHANYDHAAGHPWDPQYGPPRSRDPAAMQLYDVVVPGDIEAGHRTSNIFQLVRLASRLAAAHGAAKVVLNGDLNCHPGTLEYAVLRAGLPHLVDVWPALRGGAPGHTANTPGNTWTKPGATPIRIDYTLTNLTPVETRVVSLTTDSGKRSVSDHLGLECVLETGASVETGGAGLPPYLQPEGVRREVLGAGTRVVEAGRARAQRSSAQNWTIGLTLLALSTLPLLLLPQLMGKARKQLGSALYAQLPLAHRTRSAWHVAVPLFAVLVGYASLIGAGAIVFMGHIANRCVINGFESILDDMRLLQLPP